MQHKHGFSIFALGLFVWAITLHFEVIGQTTATPPGRLDFVTAAGQVAFPTPPITPRMVIVYRNGLLQTAGTTADYTQMPIQNGTRIRVTFNQPSGAALLVPNTGDRVTLFYY